MACNEESSKSQAFIQIAPFVADVTPPLGSPIGEKKALRIIDSLTARGIVLVGSGEPIVLCSVDWRNIENGATDVWRNALAQAANTSRERVAVHHVHQHDAPRCDFDTDHILSEYGLSGSYFDPEFAHLAIENTATALRGSLQNLQPVSHIGIGNSRVKKVASNRRILGEDGRVRLVRFSRCKISEAREAPEGIVDPILRLLVFWNNAKPVTALSYYSTHPISYYDRGEVSTDFIGQARALREKTIGDEFLHIHFNGAGGNVAAGKYNDGSKNMRPVLAGRIEEALKSSWEQQSKVSISPSEVEWITTRVNLPLHPDLNRQCLNSILSDESLGKRPRVLAARTLSYLNRRQEGKDLEIGLLNLGPASILHMPGELFVEYQLAAQAMRPDRCICLAAYGDAGPWYIGTASAYTEGGYEVSPECSLVSSEAEDVLLKAMRSLLIAV